MDADEENSSARGNDCNFDEYVDCGYLEREQKL